jgi:hypothetical protein
MIYNVPFEVTLARYSYFLLFIIIGRLIVRKPIVDATYGKFNKRLVARVQHMYI